MRIEQLTSAEPGWKAVFAELDGRETVSRIIGWAVVADDEGEMVGMIVDPTEPSRIVRADLAESPDGGSFLRYRFVQPDPIVIPVSPPPAQPTDEMKLEDAPEQLAKGLLKRKR